MLAAIENQSPPAESGRRERPWRSSTRAWPPTPRPPDLVQAKYGLTKLHDGPRRPRPRLRRAAEAESATPTGRIRRLLADIYGDEGRLDQAEDVVAELAKERPDGRPASPPPWSGLVAARPLEAAGRGDRAAARQLRQRRPPALIRGISASSSPTTSRFPQAECELAARAAATSPGR